MPYEGTSLLGYYFRVEESADASVKVYLNLKLLLSKLQPASSLSQTVSSYYRPICCLDNRLGRVAP
jgi:hypothetical protein